MPSTALSPMVVGGSLQTKLATMTCLPILTLPSLISAVPMEWAAIHAAPPINVPSPISIISGNNQSTTASGTIQTSFPILTPIIRNKLFLNWQGGSWRLISTIKAVHSSRKGFRKLPPCEFKNNLLRMIGVKIGKDVCISPDVVIDWLFPELVEIGDGTLVDRKS